MIISSASPSVLYHGPVFEAGYLNMNDKQDIGKIMEIKTKMVKQYI